MSSKEDRRWSGAGQEDLRPRGEDEISIRQGQTARTFTPAQPLQTFLALGLHRSRRFLQWGGLHAREVPDDRLLDEYHSFHLPHAPAELDVARMQHVLDILSVHVSGWLRWRGGMWDHTPLVATFWPKALLLFNSYLRNGVV